LAEAHLGHVERARSAAKDGLRAAQAGGNQRHVIRCLGVLGFVELSLGDAVAAHSYLEPALALTEEAGYAEPGVLRFEHDAAEARVGFGELDEAQRLARRLEESGRMLPFELARTLLVLGGVR